MAPFLKLWARERTSSRAVGKAALIRSEAMGQEATVTEVPQGGDVVVSVEPCLGLDPDAVERLSALEFPGASGAAPEGQTQVSVGCVDRRVVVVVTVAEYTTLTRQIDLNTESSEGRERELALLIGEAVAAVLSRSGQSEERLPEPEPTETLDTWLSEDSRGAWNVPGPR